MLYFRIDGRPHDSYMTLCRVRAIPEECSVHRAPKVYVFVAHRYGTVTASTTPHTNNAMLSRIAIQSLTTCMRTFMHVSLLPDGALVRPDIV